MFKKILVANRGEIACRIIRACREMGIASLAVYSEADRAGLHVQMGDEAVGIGPPAAAESYLNMDKTGIPIIPGMKRVAADFAEYAAEAKKIGYPVMIKASAGGGGKGMRIVCSEEDLRPGIGGGQREAKGR